MDIIYDCETYPNCFLLCLETVSEGLCQSFEISPWKDDTRELLQMLDYCKVHSIRMVGFNNLGFDYPLLHMLYKMGKATPQQLYAAATAIIQSENKFAHMVYPSDRVVQQIDLYRIHHFDNKARMTGLKALEFNMRLPNIRDLPFPPGTVLTEEQVTVLKEYCANDVFATREFYKETLPAIQFREQLGQTYEGDILNFNDVKIGKMIFQSHLENSGVVCYNFGPQGRTPKQTPRPTMRLGDCVPNYVRFDHPEFQRIQSHFLTSVITQTKGAFDGLSATVGGVEFVFGTGGLHASVEGERFDASDDMMILDVDVTSMYPSIAIENNYYPEHLGPEFVNVYRKLREKRISYPKGSVENSALKLALNGVYGASGDKFSIFYDPLFTMKITVGGQLMLAMLAEQLLSVAGLRIIQANTDGITVYMPRTAKFLVDEICRYWTELTGLLLEKVEYSLMCVADVNSYIAKEVDGKVKRKGRYEYDVEWHQNASMLVVPKIAEKVLIDGADAMTELLNWFEYMDFMLRVKVPRSSVLVLQTETGEQVLENTQRYYVSNSGGYLFKYMPPLAKNPGQWRRLSVQKDVTVRPCNDMCEATTPFDFGWYANEIDKLTLRVL